MASNIFIIELLVNKIVFAPELKELPNPKDLNIHISFTNLLNMTISLNGFPDIINKKDDRCWGLNIGKSCIFTYSFQSLIAEIQKYPLEITVKQQNGKILGKTKFPWKREFIDMLTIFQQIGVVRSVDHTNDIDLMLRDKKIGTMTFYIRMGCGGDGIESDFRLREDFDLNDWVLIHSKKLKSVLCKGYHPEKDDIVPVARLYNVTLNPPGPEATDLSWVNVPKARKKSEELDLFQLYGGSSAFDVVSVCFVPNTNIFDFINAESMKPKKMKETKKKVKEGLTFDSIRKKLCSQSECPGVKKFEELGIHSSKVRKDFSDLAPPNQNFLRHFNTSSERYCPQSTFMSPKHPNVQFSPPKSVPEGERPHTVGSIRTRDTLSKVRNRNIGPCRSCSCTQWKHSTGRETR